MNTPQTPEAIVPLAESSQRGSKKDQILSPYAGGIRDVADLALITHSRPSDVAGYLQQTGESP